MEDGTILAVRKLGSKVCVKVLLLGLFKRAIRDCGAGKGRVDWEGIGGFCASVRGDHHWYKAWR
jgi:hypothetical protein